VVKYKPTAGPHAPRQTHVWDQSAADTWMAVATQRIVRSRFPEIYLVKKWRQDIACRNLFKPPEGCGERCGPGRVEIVALTVSFTLCILHR
jgi:hypothetical protein